MTDTSNSADQRFTAPGEAWETQLLAGVSAVTSPLTSHHEAREANQVVSDVAARMAALTVRRRCNQHGCTLPSTGTCDSEDARRDADYLRHVLDVLGLSQTYEPVTDADRANLLTAMAQRPVVGVDSLSDYTTDG